MHAMHKTSPAVAMAALLISVAASSFAQGPPPICPAPARGEFDKTVCVIDGTTDACDPTRTPPLNVGAGEILQYEVVRCNPRTGSPCVASIIDDIDGLLVGREDRLTFVPDLSTACGSPADLGGALCEVGPNGGPYTRLASPAITRCGQDCAAPTEVLALAPNFTTPPPTLLDPGMCYRMTFRAQVGTLSSTECLCNQARTVTDLLGGTADSNDPNWVSIADSPLDVGCQDFETCPNPGACATCVKVPTVADLTTSQKCIDTATPVCGDGLLKTGGDPITYLFSVCNTGTTPATNIAITDPLDFTSSTGDPCLDLTAGVTIANLNCSWVGGPCGPTDATVSYAPSTLTGGIPSLPAGACVTFEALATVDGGFSGACTNAWELRQGTVGGPPQPVNAPVFQSGGFVPNGSKCVADGSGGCLTPPPARGEGDPVSYLVTFANAGDAQGRDVLISDTVPGCVTVAPASVRCVVDRTSCGGGVTCTPSFVAPDRVEALVDRFRPGCLIQVTYDTTVAVGAATPCCNTAEATWTDPAPGGSAATADVCFDVGGVVSLGASSKCIDDGAGGCEVGVTHDPPEVLHYRVRLENSGSVDAGLVTLIDLLPACLQGVPGSATCVVDASCAAVCTANATTTDVSGTADVLAAGCGITYEFDASVIAAIGGRCCNQASATWKLPTAGSVGPLESCFDRTPVLQVEKSVDGGSVAAVAPGGFKTFTITVTNNSTGPVSCTLDDNVAATSCMTRDTATACTSTPDISPTLVCGSIPTPNLVTATFDVAAGANQVITVPVVAGLTLGLCDNTVNVTCSGIRAGSTASLDITNAGCSLAKVVDPPPVVRTAPWVYTNSCSATDTRIDNTTIITSGIPGTPINLTDSADPGTTSEITLYQIDCGCTNDVLVTKTAPVGGVIRVVF